jgi:hypothetical protein
MRLGLLGVTNDFLVLSNRKSRRQTNSVGRRLHRQYYVGEVPRQLDVRSPTPFRSFAAAATC